MRNEIILVKRSLSFRTC